MSAVLRNLRCELTNEEVRLKGEQLAAALINAEKIQETAESAKQHYKAQIQAEQGTAKILQRQVAERAEYKEVRCHWEYHYSAGSKSLVRDDTGEIVETVAIGDNETQTEIDLI
jgi:hypothetical protein